MCGVSCDLFKESCHQACQSPQQATSASVSQTVAALTPAAFQKTPLECDRDCDWMWRCCMGDCRGNATRSETVALSLPTEAIQNKAICGTAMFQNFTTTSGISFHSETSTCHASTGYFRLWLC